MTPVSVAMLAVIVSAIVAKTSFDFIHGEGLTLSSPAVDWPFDDADYDNLAFSLLRHGTFAFDWDNQEWRDRYTAAIAADSSLAPLFTRHGYGITTYKPPLVPFLYSIDYRIFGTGFTAPRLMNLAFMLAAVMMAIFFAGSLGGLPMALVTALVILLRPHLQQFGATMMTESAGTFLFTLAFITFYFNQPKRADATRVNVWLSVVCGVLVALLALARSIYGLWVPLIVLGGALECWFRRGKELECRAAIKRWTIVIVSCFVIGGPWWIRNCVLTGHFAPLGTQGGTSILGAYADGVFENDSEWVYHPFIRAYSDFDASFKGDVTAPVREYYRGKYMASIAYDWALRHWKGLPLLFFERVKGHYMHNMLHLKTDRYLLRAFLTLLLVLGLMGWWKQERGKLFAVALIIDAIIIGVTFDTYSRYLAPLVPLTGVATAGVLLLYPRSPSRTWPKQSFLAKIHSAFVSSVSRFRTLFSSNTPWLVDTLPVAALAVTILVSSALYRHAQTTHASLSFPPDCACDDADYDDLAFNLAKHNAFEFNWSDQQWRSRYETYNQSGSFNRILMRRGEGMTTYYPPFFPFAVSLVYRVFGTGFALPRIMNLTFMSLAFVLAILFAGWETSVVGVVLCAVILSTRIDLPPIAIQLFTESMATFFFTLTFILMFFLVRSGRLKPAETGAALAAAAGISFALLGLTRSLYTLWAPFIVLVVAIGFLRVPRGHFRAAFLRRWTIFFAAFLIVSAPWWIRNSVMSGHVVPLGSKGSQAVAGSYSDDSFASGGEWSAVSFQSAYDTFNASFHGQTSAPAEYEYLRGQYMSGVARAWIKRNPSKIPALMLKRVDRHYFVLPRPLPQSRSLATAYLVVFLLGIIGWLLRPEGWMFLVMFLIDAVVIALTYENSGRFLMPLMPVLSVAAAGVIYLRAPLRAVLRKRKM